MWYFKQAFTNNDLRNSAIPMLCILVYGCVFGSVALAQQTEVVDFLKVEAVITPRAFDKSIHGDLHCSFKILKRSDSIYLDAKNMTIIEGDNKTISVKAAKDKVWLYHDFQAGMEYSVSFEYEVKPKQTFYFMPDGQMWTQGQGKYTSHWLPSIDDTNDKIEFDLSVVAPENKTVIANGKLEGVKKHETSKMWQFAMEKPMSSYLVAVAIGDFDVIRRISSSGVPLELYYRPEDSLKVEPTYRYSKRIFDYLEKEIGVPYPWQVYKQVPVRDFLYAGMENTTATFFSQAFVVDSVGFNDRNYVNVNAHELAHQWFGNMVTAKTDSDHWLQEGFATYYALMAEKKIFGEDYFYWQLLQAAEQLKAMSDEGKGESLLDPKASSLTFYQKGAWALHILKETIGEENFRKTVRNYLQKHRFKNVSTDDFLIEVKAVSQVDISSFIKDWLRQSSFNIEEAYGSLMKSAFIERYFQISALRATPFEQKEGTLKDALDDGDDFIGQEAVYQLMHEPILKTLPLYKTALKSNNLYVRQAVALTLEEIPKTLLPEYKDLLEDPSYVSIEAAMYQMYMQFPEKRPIILEKMEDVVGFQNKNIRQLWLVLALITEDYNPSEKNSYLKELRDYASEKYSFEIREAAFGYIHQLGLWNVATLKSLVEATVHPNWRFSKSSKALLKEVVQDSGYHKELTAVKKEASGKAMDYLNEISKK